MNKTVYIYTLSDPRDGRVRYVGATTNAKRRIRSHIGTAKSRNSARVHKWILSLLDEELEPIMEIIDTGDADNWEAKEKYWIQRYKDMGCELLNQTNGGIHCEYDEETRKRMSEALRGEKHPFYGKKLSEETRKRMSKAQSGERNPMYGKVRSEETRRKVSEAQRGERNPMYGKAHSEETRRKISKSNSRQIVQYTREGVFIRNWDGARTASKELGIFQSNIWACCQRKPKHKTAGGYIWRYADDPIPQTEQPRLFQDEDK